MDVINHVRKTANRMENRRVEYETELNLLLEGLACLGTGIVKLAGLRNAEKFS